jgi:rhodanese-related sulfurtransferase
MSSPVPVSPAAAKARVGAPDFVLLDCREPDELVIASVSGTQNIPMGEIPRRIAEIDSTKEVVVLCHHGMRAAQVAVFLARRGFPRVGVVVGGIDAWAVDVDRTIARY